MYIFIWRGFFVSNLWHGYKHSCKYLVCTIGTQRFLYTSNMSREMHQKAEKCSTLIANNGKRLCIIIIIPVLWWCSVDHQQREITASRPLILRDPNVCTPTPMNTHTHTTHSCDTGWGICNHIYVLVQMLQRAQGEHGYTCLQSTNMLSHTQTHTFKHRWITLISCAQSPQGPLHTPHER